MTHKHQYNRQMYYKRQTQVAKYICIFCGVVFAAVNLEDVSEYFSTMETYSVFDIFGMLLLMTPVWLIFAKPPRDRGNK